MPRLTCLLVVCIWSAMTTVAHACMCDYLSVRENIERYPFIAHVRILQKLGKRDTIYHKKENITHIRYKEAPVLVIEVLELFKGSDSVKTIIEYDVNSSCEIGVEAGEEWIIFGEYYEEKKIYSIGACNPSMSLRNRHGERRWHSHADDAVSTLRAAFHHPDPDARWYATGIYKGFYATGTMEWIACYTNGKLDGNRKIFYADGRLHIDEQYANGKADGWRKEYSRDGKPWKESLYKNGKCISSKEWGHPSDRDLYTGLYQEYYYRDSTYSILKQYDENGNLEEEVVENEAAGTSIETAYYESGKIEYIFTTYKREDKTVQQFWKEDGTFDKKRVYIGYQLIEE